MEIIYKFLQLPRDNKTLVLAGSEIKKEGNFYDSNILDQCTVMWLAKLPKKNIGKNKLITRLIREHRERVKSGESTFEKNSVSNRWTRKIL